MSKINGDKARRNLRDRKQAKMRARNQELRTSLKEPAKAAPKTERSPAAKPAA